MANYLLLVVLLLLPFPAQANSWPAFQRQATRLSEADKVAAINAYFNRNLRYVREVGDNWSSLEDSLAQGNGDCEDFAIAKYSALRRLGVPGSRLSLLLVKMRIGGPTSKIIDTHMVVQYTPAQGTPVILDNALQEMLPLQERSDLRPIYRLDHTGLHKL